MDPNRRTRFPLVAALAALLAAAGPACAPPEPPVRPPEELNLILIVVDALRADHLGTYGYEQDTSPHIDELAERSAVFDRAYSHSPWTMPSVATMFTSLHPLQHGIVHWKNPLDEDLLTIAEHASDHGVYTAAHASHVIFRPKYGFDQGFDEFDIEATEHGDIKYDTTSEYVTELAIETLSAPIEEPYFLWLHYFDPHNNYLWHAGFGFGRTRVGRYDSEIAYTDQYIGRLLDWLDEHGHMEDTAIVLTADHGEEFGDHGDKRHTDQLYEETLRVPLIVYVPGGEPERHDELVPLIDLAPTMVDLLDVPEPSSFRGVPIPYRDGRFQPRADRPLVAETLEDADKRAIEAGGWKLIVDREEGTRELYDKTRDRTERHDVEDAHADIADELEAVLEQVYRRSARRASEAKIDPKLQEQLESLGYLE